LGFFRGLLLLEFDLAEGAAQRADDSDVFLRYTSGTTPLTATGVGHDAEDGPLSGNSLAWRFTTVKGGVTADMPAVVYGSRIDTILRGGGDFRLVLTVTDSKGKTGSCHYDGAVSVLR
jgi:hypothetical protein